MQTRRFSFNVVLLPLVAALASVAVAPAQAQPAGPGMTDRMIVKYKNGATRSLVQARAATGRNVVARRTNAQGAELWKLDAPLSLKEANALARDLQAADATIEYAEPDVIMHATMTPTDSSYAQQWDLYETTGGLRANLAWDKASGAGVTVAVVDTGVRPHADLVANLLPGYDFISDTLVSNDGNARDADASDPGDAALAGECGSGYPTQDETSSWHGTHVAGTIAAVTNNASGVAGIAYNARVLPVRVLGKCGGYTSDIADGMIWASGGAVSGVPANTTPARVINLSLGGSGACGTTFQNAINSARSRGTTLVVAAGNDNANASNSSPANCSGVIAVAATGRTGGRAYYSNYGSVVDVAAPGGDMSTGSANGILSTLNDGLTSPGNDSYAYYQGTSMATPHVAATVALMLSKNAALTPDDVETRLKSSARPFPATCSQCGAGIVDANAAVDAATATVTPPPVSTTLAETEANNSMTTANVIAAPATIDGNLGSKTDTDYFKVSLPAGKTLTGALTLGTSTADYDLYVYDASGRLLSSSKRGAGLSESVSSSNTGTTAAVRYVRVVYYSGPTGSTSGRYSLKLAW